MDPELDLACDAFLTPDGHAQERSLLDDVLKTVYGEFHCVDAATGSILWRTREPTGETNCVVSTATVHPRSWPR